MKNKNGFTMVELLVSLVLITTLSLALFKVVANMQKKEQVNIAKNSLIAFKAVLNNNIETDFINDIITELYSCGDNCFDITYKNKGTVRLSLDGNIITYGSMKEEIPKNYKLYSNMSITFYETSEENKNAYVLLTLPIKGDLEKGFDNVKYMYLYNSRENPINDNSIEVTLDYNDGSNTKAYIKVLNGSTYGSLPQLSKNRFEFLGWYSEKVGGVLIDKDTTVLKNYNHSIYAHWKSLTLAYDTVSSNYKCANSYAGGVNDRIFAYSGDCEILRDNDDSNDWRIKFLSSGTLRFYVNVEIDAFVVGGGTAGGAASSPGKGGEAVLSSGISLTSNEDYTVVIGESSKNSSFIDVVATAGGTTVTAGQCEFLEEKGDSCVFADNGYKGHYGANGHQTIYGGGRVASGGDCYGATVIAATAGAKNTGAGGGSGNRWENACDDGTGYKYGFGGGGALGGTGVVIIRNAR